MAAAVTTSRGFFGHLCGAFAGVISAVILAFALAHSGSLLVLAVYIAAIPLFMAGFGAGPLAGLIACLVGSIGLFAAAPVSFGIFYVGAQAVPALILILMTMRHRVADGRIEWLSEGSLLAMLAIYPCLIFLFVYASTTGHEGGLLAMTLDAFDGMSAQVTGMLAENGQTVTPDVTLKVHQYLETFARVTPALAMCAWLFSTIIAMAAAQFILRQQNWNLRPTFSLTNLHVPTWIVFAAAITGVIGMFGSSPYNYIGLNLALTLGVPFVFVGFAVAHAWAAQTRWPTVALTVFYILISVIVHLVLLVALLGAVDQWVDFRKRFAEKAQSKTPN